MTPQAFSEKAHYKIMRLSDGLFSDGGMQPKFSKKGKIWRSKAAVSSHLNYFSPGKLEEIYSGCMMVELVYAEVSRNSVVEYAKEKKLESIKRQAAERLRREKEEQARVRKQELDELARLKAKYEGV